MGNHSYRPYPNKRKRYTPYVAKRHKTKVFSYGPKVRLALPSWLKKWVDNRKA